MEMLKAHCASLRKSLLSGFMKYEPANSMKNLLPFGIVNEWLQSLEKGNEMRTTNFEKVEDFMEVMGQEVKLSPEFPDEATLQLRLSLIQEEVDELEEGVRNRDIVNVAKELTDILYVVYGMGHSLGIDLDACFEEVQASNMSKLGDDGKPVIRKEDGKVLKGPNYFEPDIEKVIF